MEHKLKKFDFEFSEFSTKMKKMAEALERAEKLLLIYTSLCTLSEEIIDEDRKLFLLGQLKAELELINKTLNYQSNLDSSSSNSDESDIFSEDEDRSFTFKNRNALRNAVEDGEILKSDRFENRFKKINKADDYDEASDFEEMEDVEKPWMADKIDVVEKIEGDGKMEKTPNTEEFGMAEKAQKPNDADKTEMSSETEKVGTADMVKIVKKTGE